MKNISFATDQDWLSMARPFLCLLKFKIGSAKGDENEY